MLTIRWIVFVAMGIGIFGIVAAGPSVAAEGSPVCGTPVDVNIKAPVPDVPETVASFVGLWSDGTWNGTLCGALVVESVEPDGSAQVIYIWGKGSDFKAGFVRENATIADGKLRLYRRGAEVTYVMVDQTQLQGKYFQNGVWTIELSKH